MTSHPTVTVVIATQNRPELLRQALDAVRKQDYPGDIEVQVVYDNHAPDHTLAVGDAHRRVMLRTNTRTPGLAGARNSGILAANGELVAFCDDDDAFKPSKVSEQVQLILEEQADGCVAGIEIHYGEKLITRVPQGTQIRPEDITRDRMTGAHPSSYVFRRDFLVDTLGLVDESIPYGYGEDYDLLIRAAKMGRIMVLPRAAVDVLWHRGGSYFSRRWEAMEAGINYLIGKHPELVASPHTASWLQGQRAFALASLRGKRGEGVKAAAQSIRLNWRQPRGYLALGVASGALNSQWVVNRLNERGRGI